MGSSNLGRTLLVSAIAVAALCPVSAEEPPSGPAAAFKWQVLDPECGPRPIAFLDGSTSAVGIASWDWDFGDGTGSDEASPQHTFAPSSQYKVTLTVTARDGSTDATVALVTVPGPRPACSTDGSATAGESKADPRDGTDEDLANADTDLDGVRNASDNCPTTANAAQADADADGLGDPCDADLDADGIANHSDNCPTVANASQRDMDGNGRGDACDAPLSLADIVFMGHGMPPAFSGPEPPAGADVTWGAARGVQPAATRLEGDVPTGVALAIAGGAVVAVAGVAFRDWIRAGLKAARSRGGIVGGLLGMGLFSRISGEELLESKARQTLIATIREHPGIHFRALQRSVGVGSSSVQYHLNVLLKAGYVHRHEWKGAVGYYAEGAAVMPAHDALRSDTARQILGDIVAHPAATAKDVATRLACDPSLVAYHLRQFQGAGLIDRVTQAGAQRIVPRPDAAVALGLTTGPAPAVVAPMVA